MGSAAHVSGEAAFLDTAYVYALVNTRDQWHGTAVRWQRVTEGARRPLVTTDLVLTEIADGLAAVRFRGVAVEAIRTLRTSALVTVVPASPDLLERAMDLYEARSDKDWGLTDCASFIVMGDLGPREALTSDEHFRQAGFHALMLGDQ